MFRSALDKRHRHKADEYWHEGVRLGNVRRVVDEKSYSGNDLDNVTASVEDYLQKRASTQSPGLERFCGEQGLGQNEAGPGEIADKKYVLRSFKIGASQGGGGANYGHTEGCPGCIWLQNRLGLRNHSRCCRRKFEEAMGRDEDDQDKVERAKARVEEWKGEQGSGNQAGVGEDQRNEPKEDEPTIEDRAVEKSEGRSRQEEGDHRHGNDEEFVPYNMDEDSPEQPEGMEDATCQRTEVVENRGTEAQASPRRRTDGKMRHEKSSEGGRPKASSQSTQGGVEDMATPDRRPFRPPVEFRIDTPETRQGEDTQGNTTREGGPGDDSREQGSTDSAGLLWEAQRNRYQDNQMTALWDRDDGRLLCAAIVGIDITEVFSPARIIQTCNKFKLVPGSALDLHTGWDFTLASHRLEASRKLIEEAPLLLIGSHPCTIFPFSKN